MLIFCGAARAQIAAPTNLHTVPSEFYDDQARQAVVMQFNWTDNSTGETGYQVEVSTNGTTFYPYATLPANTAAFDVAVVPWTTVRYWRVKAFNATSSAYSSVLRVVGNMPPTHLAGSTTAANQMTVTWETAGGQLSGYKVQQDTSPTFDSPNLVNYSVSGQASATYNITYSFAPNTMYYFRVLSTSGGGDSEAYDKPPYVAVAPNGPPTPPIFVTAHTTAVSTNGDAPTELRIIFDDTALNETGFTLGRSTDSINWVNIPVQFTGATRYEVFDEGLLPGTQYYYRLAAVNSRGISSYVNFQITMPNKAPAGTSIWYIDNAATGNSDGASWANAWKSLGAINWTRLGPGHTVFISGGTTDKTYEDYLVTVADGAFNNPITFKTATNAPHNGKVKIIGQVAWKSKYVTIDGARNPGFVLNRVTDITNNINLEVIGRGDVQAGLLGYTVVGAVARWIEVHDAGNPLCGEGEGDGIDFLPYSQGPTNSEVAYCWVHDNWGSGMLLGIVSGYGGLGGLNIHHVLVERNHNNFIMGQGGYDLHDSILRDWKAPGVAHPDGIQGGINNVRIWNNVISRSCVSGSMFYPDLGLDQANLYLVNNLFVGDVVDCQFALSSAPSSLTVSNVVIAGNTFYADSRLSFSVVNNGQANRRLRAWVVKNNLFNSGPNCSSAAASFSTGGCSYQQSDVQFDYNIVCGPQKIISYMAVYYNTAEALNAATAYKHNSSSSPTLFSVPANKFNLLGIDTVARNAGADLSTLATKIPAITNDIYGTPRTPGAWSIGAYEYSQPGLQLQLVFENDFYSSISKYAVDVSGNNRDGLRFGRPTSMTNYPTPTISYDNSVAAEFHYYPNDIQQGQPQYFTADYIAVTNITGIRILTNMTVAAWVNYYDGDSDANATIFSAGLTADGEWRFGRDGVAQTAFTVATNSSQIPDYKFISFPDSGVTNQWHHYAVTWSGANHQAIAYYDGVPVKTNAAPTLDYLIIGGVYLGIGCWTFDEDPWIFPTAIGGNDNHPNNGWLHGAMDDLRLYNRTLSAAEVQSVFGGGGPSPASIPVRRPQAPTGLIVF